MQGFLTHLLAVIAGAGGMYVWMKIGRERRDAARDAVGKTVEAAKDKLGG